MSQQIERIETMENNMNACRQAVDALSEALEHYKSVLGQMEELSTYYGSPEWMSDYEDDEAGKLPEDLRRGVLSEDLAYDLLVDNHELIKEMLKVASLGLDSEDR